MVTLSSPLAMINCELRQAWKGATVAVDSCAGVWLVRVTSKLRLCEAKRNQNDDKGLKKFRRGVRAAEGAGQIAALRSKTQSDR